MKEVMFFYNGPISGLIDSIKDATKEGAATKRIYCKFKCPECDHEWGGYITVQYGISNLDRDKDGYCSLCGAEGECLGDYDVRDEIADRRYHDWKDDPDRILLGL